MFIGRQEELAELNNLYSTDKFQCVIIYGRRRVGKTTLISEFVKGKQALFFAATENNSDSMREEFCNRMYQALNAPSIGTLDSWQSVFQFIAKETRDRRLVLVIDEFPYLAKADKEIKSVLQNVIDHYLKDTKLFLILCGSQVSFMEKEVLGYNSPLYGRRTAQIKLEPFSFFDSREFFPKYDIEKQIQAYCMLGGIPLYLSQFDDNDSLEDNIKGKILRKYSYLYEEPKNLLKQELREPMNYNAIIEAIATGATTLNNIVGKSKLPSDHCSKYLKTLMELLLVEREIPVGEPKSSRRGIYRIQDAFFKFWYRFVFPNTSELELGMTDDIFKEEILPELPKYYGQGFELVCHQHFLRELKEHRLPFRFSHIGRWWGNNPVMRQQEEIDLFAAGKDGAYIGECKWRNEKVDKTILDNLVRKGQQLFSAIDNKVYVLYSKSGFTSEVNRIAKKDNSLILYGLEDF